MGRLDGRVLSFLELRLEAAMVESRWVRWREGLIVSVGRRPLTERWNGKGELPDTGRFWDGCLLGEEERRRVA